MSIFIHPSAVIDEPVQIGEDTRIWHFCHLMPNCRIGKRCTLGQNVFVAGKVTLGNDVKVQNNVSLFEGLHCQDEVFIGPSVTFTNVRNPRAGISRRDAFQSTHVLKGATIGANATVLCGITIGAWAFVGAGAVVLEDVPNHALYVGNPARRVGWMSREGHRLYFGGKQITTCRQEGRKYIREGDRVRHMEE